MGQDELVLKIDPDNSSPTKTPLSSQHRRGASNSSSAKISTASTASSPSGRKESIVKVTYSRKDDVENDLDCLNMIGADDDDSSNRNDDCDRLSDKKGEGMLSGESQLPTSDYGSFATRDTYTEPSVTAETAETASTVAGTTTTIKSSDEESCAPRSSPGLSGNEHYQREPLLSTDIPSDSASGDDVGNSNGYTRRKTKVKSNNNNNRSIRIDIDGDNADAVDCETEIPPDKLKTFYAFVFLVVAWIATTTSLALTHERVPDVDPLPDVTLDNFPYQSWGLDTSEILIIVAMWIAFLVVLFHKNRFVIFRRIFLLVGIHYYYRSITMFITVLPKADPNYKCAPKLNGTTTWEIAQRVLKLLSGMGLSINGQHIYCGDYIYSGHTMSLIMTYLVIKEYSPKKWFLFHGFFLVLAITGVVTLLLGRGHYSIDVLIAYYITTRLWWIYHTLAHNAHLKEKSGPLNYVGQMWWFPIFRYFEENVPAVQLKRSYNLPVPDMARRWWEARGVGAPATS